MTTENAVAPKKSLAELLVEAEARVERLKRKIAAEALINNVDQGDKVSFSYGRNGLGVGKRTLEGVVTAKGETEQGLKRCFDQKASLHVLRLSCCWKARPGPPVAGPTALWSPMCTNNVFGR